MSPNFAFTPLPATRQELRKPAAISGLAGTWRGETVDEQGNTEVFTLLRDGSSDAMVAGRFLFFATRHIAPTGVRLLEASARSFVALVGPYYDPQLNAELMTVFEGVRRGDTVEGWFYSRMKGWREPVRSGRFKACRADTADRAA